MLSKMFKQKFKIGDTVRLIRTGQKAVIIDKGSLGRSDCEGTAVVELSRISPSVIRNTSPNASVITSKAANGYHFKTGQREWPSRTENVLPCRLLWWQVGFGAPASRAALEHVAVVQ
jgi:hypothetical protein